MHAALYTYSSTNMQTCMHTHMKKEKRSRVCQLLCYYKKTPDKANRAHSLGKDTVHHGKKDQAARPPGCWSHGFHTQEAGDRQEVGPGGKTSRAPLDKHYNVSFHLERLYNLPKELYPLGTMSLNTGAWGTHFTSNTTTRAEG